MKIKFKNTALLVKRVKTSDLDYEDWKYRIQRAVRIFYNNNREDVVVKGDEKHFLDLISGYDFSSEIINYIRNKYEIILHTWIEHKQFLDFKYRKKDLICA